MFLEVLAGFSSRILEVLAEIDGNTEGLAGFCRSQQDYRGVSRITDWVLQVLAGFSSRILEILAGIGGNMDCWTLQILEVLVEFSRFSRIIEFAFFKCLCRIQWDLGFSAGFCISQQDFRGVSRIQQVLVGLSVQQDFRGVSRFQQEYRDINFRGF